MVFKGPAGFQRVIYIVMNIVIGILLSIALTVFVMHQPLSVLGIAISALTSFFIGYVASDLIPAMAWGQELAGRMGLTGVAAHFISSAVLAFFMGTLILLFMAVINVLPTAGVTGLVGFFISAYPLVLIAAYVAILIFLPLAMRIATSISGFNPAMEGR